MSIEELLTLPDWGTVPDWLAAVGTISAVGWALHLGLRDGKRLDDERHEAKQDREAATVEREDAARERALFREQQAAEAAAQKRRLASKVSVSVERIIDDLGDRKLRWTVHNGSDEPIAMASIVGRKVPTDEGPETPSLTIHKTWTSIEAGGQRDKETAIFGKGDMREGELQFKDGAGQRWQRMEFGLLREIGSNDPQALNGVPIQR